MSWNSFNKPTLCESCGNTDCSDCGKRNIHWQGSNICGSYLKVITFVFGDGYKLIQHYDVGDEQHYSLLNENREKCLDFNIKEGLINRIVHKDLNIQLYKKILGLPHIIYTKGNVIEEKTFYADNYRDIFDELNKVARYYLWYIILNNLISLKLDSINTILLANLLITTTEYEQTLDWSLKIKDLPTVFAIMCQGTRAGVLLHGSDIITKIEDIIIKTKNYKYAYKFAEMFVGFNINKLENFILTSNDSEHIIDFASHVKSANITKLEDEIINRKEPRVIYLFAKYVDKANTKRLEDAFLTTKPSNDKALWTIGFAKYIKNADIQKFEDVVIEYKDAEYMYDFAMRVKGANIKRLKEAIIETGDQYYIDRLNEL